MANDLVFEGSPATGQPVALVFNDSAAPSLDRQLVGAGSLAPLRGTAGAVVIAAVATGAGTFEPLVGHATIGQGKGVVGDGYFAPLTGAATGYFNSDTQRPTVGTVRDSFQNGLDTEIGVTQFMQDGLPVKASTEGRYQEALATQAGFEAIWQQARSLRQALDVHYQQALKLRNGFDDGYTNALHRRQGVDDSYQQGVKVRHGFRTLFQDTLKRRGVADDNYQQAKPYISGSVTSRVQRARRANSAVDDRYQDAIRPPGGQWFRPPVPPAGDPCYIPDPNLVFDMVWSSDTGLVFICERHGGTGPDPEPGATVVVPVKRVYAVLNTSSLYRVDGHVLLPTFGMTMSLDVESWTWSFSASLPATALDAVTPDSDGTPVMVEAMVNGVPYRFKVTKISRDRAFASTGIRINGRGIADELDAPTAAIMNFGNASGRTAQQLMADVLSLNGVPLDWTIDWQLTDWSVPGVAWTKQGTYIEALNEIAAAAGGYIQPVPSARTLRVLPRFPVLPWNWSTDVTPDYELPDSIAVREATDWVEKPRYNRVFVSGQQGGVLVNVSREGTAGDVVAPMVTDSLITHVDAGRQRGQTILADTGRIANYTLSTAVGVQDTDDTPIGIIPPGKFVRYIENGVPRLGITRSVSVNIGTPEIMQSIGLEIHETA